MALLNKIDSNATGLRYALEESYGVLPGSGVVWYPLEPNSYADFGGSISTVARNPINQSRQRQKGVVTDLTANGGFNMDLTQTNLQDLLQGFFFADFRRKPETVFAGKAITSVDGTGETYTVTATSPTFLVGHLVLASGFTLAANNGLKRVTNFAANVVTVAENLSDETPAATAGLTAVGFQTAAGDLDVSVPGGDLPRLTTTTLDFTTLGLIPGEWLWVGGDTAPMNFSTAANKGWVRIKSVAAHTLILDKTDSTWVTEANTTQTVQFFFGRVLKNESDPSRIVRRTYQLERTLGAPDDSSSDTQGEYLVGAVPGQLTINFQQADKVMCDLSFEAKDAEQVTAGALKAGSRPSIVVADGFNTTSDFSRLKMVVLDPVNSNPTALFGFVTEFSLTINNSLSPNKAISVLGNFEVTAGQFLVDGSATAYFSTIEATQAVRNNSDVSFDFAIVKGATGSKAGVLFDVPLIALGDGRPAVEQDQAITVPLTMPAAADRNFNHTLLSVFFDFLPNAAA